MNDSSKTVQQPVRLLIAHVIPIGCAHYSGELAISNPSGCW